jgi:SAM-dependent methyltransferase
MADYLKIIYSEKKRPFTDYPSQLVKHLFDEFNLKPGMKILEPGSGRGEFLKSFKDLGLDVVGIDISDSSKDFFLKEEMELVVYDLESEKGLPFPNESFDIIFNKSLLEHLHKPDSFLREAHRILRPNGKIICLVPDWESNYKTYFDDFTHRTPFTKPSLEDILKITDFDDVEVYKFRQLPIVWKFPILNLFCALISPFIPVRVNNKFLRWSRELMLVGSAVKRSS